MTTDGFNEKLRELSMHHLSINIYNKDWVKVVDRLNSEGIPATYFIWFCLYKLNGSGDPALFKRPSYAASQKVWESFIMYWDNLEDIVNDSLRYQRRSYEELKDDFGSYVLLKGDMLSLTPEVRCDLALRDLAEEECGDILSEYEEEALYKITGCPMLREKLMFFNKHLADK